MATNFSNNDSLAVAGTAQRVAAGAETKTFAEALPLLTITYASKACWIAATEAGVGAAAGGAAWDRVYVPEGAVGLTIPWNSDDVWFLNAVGGEQPFISVVGHREP